MAASERAPLLVTSGNVHEKVAQEAEPAPPKTTISRIGRILGPSLLVIWLILHLATPFWGLKRDNGAGHEHINKPFEFGDIVPSQKLEWHDCSFGIAVLKCARLTVPMDYNRPLNVSDANPKVDIALVLVPGVHGGSKNYSTSPLLINPGGPGGSGTMFAISGGSLLQKIVGADQDIIGFDPRGIGSTTPRADCFSTPLGDDWDYVGGDFHRLLWSTAGRQIGLVNSSSDSLAKIDARARATAKLCQNKDAMLGKDSIFKYVNTVNVARDMLSIVDAWDEWTASLNSDTSAANPKKSEVVEEEATADKKVLDTRGKLVYWGFSYGTLLGATFASMFPDRVGRVVLDGVVDADYYVAPIWAESLLDTDADANSFFTYCHQAKSGCALYRPSDKISDVKKRYQDIMTAIQIQPIITVQPTGNIPAVITYSTIKSLLFVTLYSPVQLFALAAMFLDMLARGLDQSLSYLEPQYDLPLLCGPPLPPSAFPSEAQNAIMCSDKRYPLNETLPGLQTRFEEMANISSWADIWMTLMVGCDSWGIQAVDPPMRWDDHPAHKQKPIKTSFPVLFVSNTADPVTPLKAGVKMAEKFIDSGLFEQKSEGHCSIAAVSKCSIAKIRAYFAEGVVPPHPIKGGKGRELEDGKWDRCEADEWPFHPFNGNAFISERGVEATADVEAMNALQSLQEVFRKQKFWGQETDGLELAMEMFL